MALTSTLIVATFCASITHCAPLTGTHFAQPDSAKIVLAAGGKGGRDVASFAGLARLHVFRTVGAA